MIASDPALYAQKRITHSITVVLLMLLLPWGVHLYAFLFDDPDVISYGLRPWRIEGLLGIVTMPFLHGGINHLVSNSIPFFVLGSGLFYFYRESAWKVLFWIALLTGIWLWFIGSKGSNHIGASGIVYGLVGFHFTGGIIRKNKNLMAFALLVIFLYGGFIWSIFPDFFPDRNISWEGHLAGLTAGVLMAFVCRKCGPQPDPTPFDDECDDDDDEECDDEDDEETSLSDAGGQNTTTSSGHPFRYHVT